LFPGVTLNIPSYTLPRLMVAQVTGLKPVDFAHPVGDGHIHSKFKDFTLKGDNPQPARKAPVAA